jgi:hypothetical protein
MSKFSDHLDMKVNLPEIHKGKILIPEMFIKQEDNIPTGRTKINEKGERVAEYKKGWTIAQNVKGNKSINKTRQISSRDKHPVLDLRTAKVDSVQQSPHFIPRLADFPKPEDRFHIFKYLTNLHPNEEHEYPENLSRGFPPILPKNWRRKKLGEYPKDYTPPYDSDEEEEKFINLFNEELKENAKARTKKSKTLHEDIFGSDTESEEEGAGGGKRRGRPRKHKTQEESYQAKIKSNKDKRTERRLEERRNKIKVKLEKGEKLTKKEKELHEAEGKGIKHKKMKGEGGCCSSHAAVRPEHVEEAVREFIEDLNQQRLQRLNDYLDIHRNDNLQNNRVYQLIRVIPQDLLQDIIQANEDENERVRRRTTMPQLVGYINELMPEGFEVNAFGDTRPATPTGNGIKDPCWKGYEMIGMKKKKGKNVPNCVPKGKGIDFQDIKWGTFKALYNRFIKKNPQFKEHIEDLAHFADFVLENKDKFSKTAEKKALFFKNILENHK